MAVSFACLGLAANAQALGFSGLVAQPADTSAGAHSNFHVHIDFTTPGDDVKDLTIHLPPGLIGDPNATPFCTSAQLSNDSCPAASQVGTTSTTVAALGLLPLTVDGSLYNVQPNVGEPARFGIVLRPVGGVLPKIILQSQVQLRQSDFGLDTIIKDIPNTASGVPIDVDSMDITLFGQAGSPAKPFMRNPTSCGTATTGFDATSYAHPSTTAHGTAAFTPTNCDALPFSPTLTAHIGSPGTTQGPSKPPLTTAIEQDAGEAGLKTAQVVLPSGIGADNDALNFQCSDADFRASTCPPATIVGSVRATSPLLTDPLTGPVALVAHPPGLPQLGLDLKGQLSMQIRGSFVFTANGPGNEFDTLPDIPISRFELTFDANHLIVNSNDLCAPPAPTFQTDFEAFSGASQTGPVAAIPDGCGASSGDPTATITLGDVATKHPTLRLRTDAGDDPIRRVSVGIPTPLQFGGPDAFAAGATASDDAGPLPPSAITHDPSQFAVTSSAGTQTLRSKLAGKALRKTAPLPAKLTFPVTVKDTTGTKTTLQVKVPVS